MSCGSQGGKFTRKKIMMFSVVGVGIAAASYFALTSNNIQTVAASSALLGIMACPIMCGVMGGIMWMVHRINRKKNKNLSRRKDIKSRRKSQVLTPDHSCCNSHDVDKMGNHKRERFKYVEIPVLGRLKKKLKRNTEDSVYN
jgi:phosphate/sulfate permease